MPMKNEKHLQESGYSRRCVIFGHYLPTAVLGTWHHSQMMFNATIRLMACQKAFAVLHLTVTGNYTFVTFTRNRIGFFNPVAIVRQKYAAGHENRVAALGVVRSTFTSQLLVKTAKSRDEI